MQAIRQYQATFRVRIENFNGFTTVHGNDIARPIGIGTGHVFTGPNHAMDLDVWQEF